MCLYDVSKFKMCDTGGTSKGINLGVGVHQGSIQKTLFFVLVLNEVSRENQRGRVGEKVYPDDLVLTGEFRQNAKGLVAQ